MRILSLWQALLRFGFGAADPAEEAAAEALGHARARASFPYYSFVNNLNADAPSSLEGRRILVIYFHFNMSLWAPAEKPGIESKQEPAR